MYAPREVKERDKQRGRERERNIERKREERREKKKRREREAWITWSRSREKIPAGTCVRGKRGKKIATASMPAYKVRVKNARPRRRLPLISLVLAPVPHADAKSHASPQRRVRALHDTTLTICSLSCFCDISAMCIPARGCACVRVCVCVCVCMSARVMCDSHQMNIRRRFMYVGVYSQTRL